jgi:16S rRNA (guanine966-N2)-methyltransferase
MYHDGILLPKSHTPDSQITPSHHAPKQQLRIIGGQWRGRKLVIAEVDGLRPTGDRIRETLFNWLMGEIPDSHCLDLFSGSGALGLECLSRGAREVTLLEKHPTAIKQLGLHCQTLSAKNANVIETDALTWLASHTLAAQSIDIVFIDPPFSANIWQQTIAQLNQSGLLKEGALIYIETPKGVAIATPEHWFLHKEKHAGQVSYRLFRLEGTLPSY